MCDSYTHLHDPSKTGAAKSQIPMRGLYRNNEIPTTTAGGLWGAYLMTVVNFCERGNVMWCGVVWRGVVWNGMVWCRVVWCGVVSCGVEWCGVVWCGGRREEGGRKEDEGSSGGVL